MLHANKFKRHHAAEDICRLFDSCFAYEFNTCLVGGGDEPVYLPAGSDCPIHRIVFRADYFASALHEIAHWCVAGAARRQMVDYGYWYAPDGRDRHQQIAFEQVEVYPQALEWMFCQAADYRFRPSSDNLELAGGPSPDFCVALVEKARDLCTKGLNSRACRFATALHGHYRGSNFYNPALYRLSELPGSHHSAHQAGLSE